MHGDNATTSPITPYAHVLAEPVTAASGNLAVLISATSSYRAEPVTAASRIATKSVATARSRKLPQAFATDIDKSVTCTACRLATKQFPTPQLSTPVHWLVWLERRCMYPLLEGASARQRLPRWDVLLCRCVVPCVSRCSLWSNA